MKVFFSFIFFWVGMITCYSQSNIDSIEYFFDTDPGLGLGTIIDINPDSENLDQNFNIPTTGLSIGTHRLFIRIINTNGEISTYEHKAFRITSTTDFNNSDIVEAEYFVDNDPGVGLATTIDITDSESINEALSISTSSLSDGIHRLFIRVKNSNNQWSLYEHKTFRIASTSENNSFDITDAEYFIDNDPGVGLATTIDLVDGESIDEALSISTNGLSEEVHRLFIRIKNSNNQWSLYEHKTFRVAPSSENNSSDITEAEYFVDNDPGVGLATAIDLVDGESIDETLSISTNGLSEEVHRLFIRVKNSNNQWSLYEHKTFRVAPNSEVNNATIIAAEYFIDEDPGIGNGASIGLTGNTIDEDLIIPTSASLAQGDHFLHIRVQNNDGSWSLYDNQLFEIDGTLNLNSNELQELKIYPNPVSTLLNIDLPKNISIEKTVIYNAIGKKVSISKNASKQIDMTNLSSGVYLIIIETDKGSISKKIIKK